MSSTNKTANLKLHSWVRTDPVVCEDFNDNFNKIDDAVGRLNVSSGNCIIYSGSYVGNGSKTLTLNFSKLPVIFFIQMDSGSHLFYSSFIFDGAVFNGPYLERYYDIIYVNGTSFTLSEIDTGESMVFNRKGSTYRYVALTPAS